LECLWQPLESADSAAPIATARSTDTGAEVLQLEVSELATVQDDCQTALEHLFSHVQQRPLDRPLQLTLIARETSVNSEALRSALRSLALERPAWQCSWLQLPPLNQPQPTADQYIQLQNLAQEQAEIRWLDGVTAVPRLQPLSSERFQVMSNGSGRLDDLQRQPLAPMRS